MPEKPWNILVVEDSEDRIAWFKQQYRDANELIFTDDPDEAIRLLSREKEWDVLFLDQDLGKEPKSGRNVTLWLCAQPREVQQDLYVLVHSVNVVSGPKIEREMQAAGRPCRWLPFYILARQV
jgi:CheY-like chemotaxis protein